MGTIRALTLLGIVLIVAASALAPAVAQQPVWRSTFRDSSMIFRGLDGADSLHFMIACWRPRENFILASSDGGMTWQRAFTDSARFVGGRWIYRPKNMAIAYPTRDVAVMTGDSGYVVTTGDGGRTWSSQRVSSFHVEHLTMQDGQRGALTLISDPNTLLSTSDGGTTWDTVPSPPPPIGNMRYIRAVAAPAPGAFLCLWERAHATTLALTTDGGAAWQYNERPFGDSIARVIFSFIDAGNGWAAVSKWLELGRTTQRTLIFRTSDGGRTWVKQYDQLSKGLAPTDVEFVDDQHGLVTGPKEILRTTDGGVSWTLESDDRADGEFGDYYVAYPSRNKAVIGVWSGGVLQRSSPSSIGPERSLSGRATVIPNPSGAGDHVRLQLPAGAHGALRVELVSSIGTLVARQLIEGTDEPGSMKLPTTGLPPGLYFARVLEDGRAAEVIPVHIVP